METIRQQLEFQVWRWPQWTKFHFPAIDDRGTPVEYADVENMTPRQADSVRHLLANSILYGRKRICQRRARSVSFLANGEEGEDEWPIRVRQLEEALRDLCAVYGLQNLL